MIDAIIGSTGFVGGILAAQHSFGAQFNSTTIGDISGYGFGTVVCAAAPGSMFMANRRPEYDLAQIEALITHLDQVSAQRFVLISSIAVLKDFAAGDDEGTAIFQSELPYGRHRRLLEAFCESRFTNCLIVRLPALFGPRLRKNFLFDLINPVPTMLSDEKFEILLAALHPSWHSVLSNIYSRDLDMECWKLDRRALDAQEYRTSLNMAVLAAGMSSTQFHNPNSTYQYYDMARLWQDIATANQAGLSHIHLATAPLRAADIHARLVGSVMPDSLARLHIEDMHTCHSSLWGREGPYLEDDRTVLNKLETFFRSHGPAA